MIDDAKTLTVGALLANGVDGDDVGHMRVYQRDDSKLARTSMEKLLLIGQEITCLCRETVRPWLLALL